LGELAVGSLNTARGFRGSTISSLQTSFALFRGPTSKGRRGGEKGKGRGRGERESGGREGREFF